MGHMFPDARLNWGFRSNEHLNFPTREAALAALNRAVYEYGLTSTDVNFPG